MTLSRLTVSTAGLSLCLGFCLGTATRSAFGDDSQKALDDMLTSAAEDYRLKILPTIDPKGHNTRILKQQAEIKKHIERLNELVDIQRTRIKEAQSEKDKFGKGMAQGEIDILEKEIKELKNDFISGDSVKAEENKWKGIAKNSKDVMKDHIASIYYKLMHNDIRSNFNELDTKILDVKHQKLLVQMAYDKSYMGKFVQTKLEKVLGGQKFCDLTKKCPGSINLDEDFNGEYKPHAESADVEDHGTSRR